MFLCILIPSGNVVDASANVYTSDGSGMFLDASGSRYMSDEQTDGSGYIRLPADSCDS